MSARAAGREPSWRSLLAPWRAEAVRPMPPPRPARNPVACLAATLRRSGFGPFLEAVRAARSGLTVVVNDPHRDAGTREALEAILGGRGGRRAPAPVSLLVACGSHRFAPAERRRHEASIVAGLRRRFASIVWHDAGDPQALAPAGRFRLHRLVAEARFVVGVGSLEPHYFAGCTGAHKTLTIGVMGLSDIEANHRGALSLRAAPLALDGNPVFEGVREVLDALRAAGTRLFALDILRVAGRTVGAFAGEPLRALREALPLVRRTFAHTLPVPADVVVARVRPPLDGTLYQADKAIKNVEPAVRDGGVLLLEARCPGGVGLDRFVRLLERAPDHHAAAALVEAEGYVLGDHKALRLRRLTGARGVRLGIVSPCLDAAIGRTLGAAVFRRRRAAAAWARAVLPAPQGGAVRACIVEDAGNVVLRAGRPT